MSNTAAVTDGKVENQAITTTQVKNTGTSALGKDAFLQILVAQMQYQDPLQPSSDTEWIAQLAQFTSLESMQNMSTSLDNSQAFSMVGKTVQVKTDKGIKEGVVEYVSVKDNKSYVNIDGGSYKASDVVAVLGSDYLAKVYGPQVEAATVTFDHDNPKAQTFKVDLGSDSYAATGMYVALNDKLIDSNYLSYDEKKGVLTVAPEAFAGLASGGSYDVSFIFDNPVETVVTGTVTVKVKGTQPEVSDKENTQSEATDNTDSAIKPTDGATDNTNSGIKPTDGVTDSKESAIKSTDGVADNKDNPVKATDQTK